MVLDLLDFGLDLGCDFDVDLFDAVLDLGLGLSGEDFGVRLMISTLVG